MMIMTRRRTRNFTRQVCYCMAAGFLVLWMAVPCLAWGNDGHRIIGVIAWPFLTDDAKKAIKDLLGDESLAEAGTWADEIRKDKSYDWAKPLHYINVPRESLDVDQHRDCGDGECVLGGIERYSKVLRDNASTREQKVEALKFLVHFVEDVHQPLHVSYADDKGGNTRQVLWFDKGTNLHAVWDYDLIQRRIGNDDWSAYANHLRNGIRDADMDKWRSEKLDPNMWATESLTITRQIYSNLQKNRKLDQAYYVHHIPIVENRLQAAGVRLALLLNDIFAASAAPEPATTETVPSDKTNDPAAIRP